jgi:purine-binding chemotaxis protein CheW
VTALFVLFQVAGSEYALAASDVLQMETYSGATRVPGAPEYVAGLIQIRGRVVPVVDLRVRFGMPAAESTLDSRVVVVQRESRVVALLADSAREIVRLDPGSFQPPPEVVVDEAKGFVKLVAQSGKRIVMLLDPGAVIGEETLDGEQRSAE